MVRHLTFYTEETAATVINRFLLTTILSVGGRHSIQSLEEVGE
jgi:hypothetical protein